MATTESFPVGNGTTGPYSFNFPYFSSADVKVNVNGSPVTDFSLPSQYQILFTTLTPSSSDVIRIYRVTDDTNLSATFYPGSAIRSQDLNDNFTQNLYVTQEANRNASESLTTVNSANQNADAAVIAANTAVTTANQAATDAATAVSTANAATTTATTALSTANAASTTANNANTTATTALSTANTASSSATTAVNTANSAATDAAQALSLVSAVVEFTIITNVAAIPGSPADGDGVEVLDSTGIESFTPLTGVPSGFTGSSELRVKIRYTSATSTWEWIAYNPVDPDNRYGSKAVLTQVESDLTQAQADILNLDSNKLDATTAASTYLTQTNAASTYLTQANASSTYLTQANATSTYLTQSAAASTYLTQTNAALTYQVQHTNTTTAVNKTLVNNERCTVTAAGITVTLPASPSQGNEVTIIVGGAFTNTIVGRNGSNIMSLSQDLTIDRENVSVTLLYVDATRGWRII